MPQLEIGSGRTLVRVNWRFWGADLCVHIGGGDDHVGAVALAGRAENGASCAESLCMEMIVLANEAVAREWLAESPDTREVFDLPSAVSFAAGFFVPLAESCRQAA